jgi:mannose-6-phosphate isomerase-like protein (cupin superfamily)
MTDPEVKAKTKVNAKKAINPGQGAAHTISGDAKAHARHTIAKINAQKEKNDTKAAAHATHKSAGMTSHKVSYDAKTGGHRAESDDAMADAHNPHKNAGIESYKLSHDAKTGGHKAVSEDAMAKAPKTRTDTGLKTQKVSDDKKTGAHKTLKKGFVANLEEETRKNMDFRRVIYTGKNCQLVLMCLKPMEDIGMETHDDVDQFFRFEEGQGAVVIDGRKHAVKDGNGVIVPCGAEHNVINTSKTANLKMYTIYSPPEHMDKVVRKTKKEALAKEEHFNKKTTE